MNAPKFKKYGIVLVPFLINGCAQQLAEISSFLSSASLITTHDKTTSTKDSTDHLAILAGQGQSQSVNTILTQAIQVQAMDSDGNPILTGDIHVQFTALQGTTDILEATTDTVMGAATTTWALPTTSGVQQLQVTATEIPSGNVGSTVNPLIFSATATAGAPSTMVMNIANPSALPTSQNLPILLQVQDQYGNLENTYSGIATLTANGNALFNGGVKTFTIALSQGIASVTISDSTAEMVSLTLQNSSLNFSSTQMVTFNNTVGTYSSGGTPGTLDSTFNAGVSNAIINSISPGQETILPPYCTGIVSATTTSRGAAVIQNDGKILIVNDCGSSSTSTYGVSVTRINSDGMLDTSFANGIGSLSFNPRSGYSPHSNAIITDASSNIFVGGWVSNNSTLSYPSLVKILPNGNLDTTFNSSGIVINQSLSPSNSVNFAPGLILSGSDIIYSGALSGVPGWLLSAYYTSSGSLDYTFGSAGNTLNIPGTISSSNSSQVGAGPALISGSSLWIAGISNPDQIILAQYSLNGTVLQEVSSVPIPGATQIYTINGMVMDPTSGSIYVAAAFTNSTTPYSSILLKYTNSGVLDTSWPLRGTFQNQGYTIISNAIPYVMAIDSTQRVLIAVNSNLENSLAWIRTNTDGSIDTTVGTAGTAFAHFGSAVGATPSALLVDAQGRIVLVGTAFFGGISNIIIARFTP